MSFSNFRRYKPYPPAIFAGVLLLSLLGLFVNFIPPETAVSKIVFFILIGLISLTVGFGLTVNKRLSVILSLGSVSLLLLFYFNLNQLLYISLLLAVLFCLELYLR